MGAETPDLGSPGNLPPKRKGGWPKGKPRKPPAPAIEPIAQQPSAEYEPVAAAAILLSGQKVEFKASSFDCTNGRYTFVSFPARRGFKTVTILKADQLAMLEITAPDQMCEALRAVPPPPPPAYLPQTGSGPGGTPVRVAYDGGDPRILFKDQRAEQAQDLPNAPGIPASRITRSEDGLPEIIGATMR